MSHPFPGMNPWLESSLFWHSVHQSLIVALRDELAPLLRPRYFVAIETHTYIAVSPDAPLQSRQPGRDREGYLQKRETLLDSSVHFVEIDLLRAGPSMPHTEKAVGSHYRLFIRRSERPRLARLYPFSVRQPIPTFPLPLRPDDVEPTVDLGALLQGVYDRAGYDLVVRYNQPPHPPLGEDDAAWAAALPTKQA